MVCIVLMTILVATTITPSVLEEQAQIAADTAFDYELYEWTIAYPIVHELPYAEPGIFRVDYGGWPETQLYVTLFVPRYEDESEIDATESMQAFEEWYDDYRTRTGDYKEYGIEFTYY